MGMELLQRTEVSAPKAETLLKVNHLSKTFGKQQALKNVSFSVKTGSSFGLLGPNGAGKSTTMKILTGIIQADGGTAELLGKSVLSNKDLVAKNIGYVPQEITLYDEFTAIENLNFFGELYGVKGKVLKTRMDKILADTGLAERANDKVKTFSGGMKRRINIGCALLHEPKLLILDEPTVGIDPQSRNRIFEMIRALNNQGVTIIYSTHYMEEVEQLCDEAAIIDHGEVMAHGPLGELLERHGRKAIYLEAVGMEEALVHPLITKSYREGSGWILESNNLPALMQQLLRISLEHKWDVKQLEVVRPSLEQVFLTVTGTALRD
ncbi:MAG: ATP-binding cassette domain-containing protein [Tuberibacillus sp.]